jgi:hypothetical protein
MALDKIRGLSPSTISLCPFKNLSMIIGPGGVLDGGG